MPQNHYAITKQLDLPLWFNDYDVKTEFNFASFEMLIGGFKH